MRIVNRGGGWAFVCRPNLDSRVVHLFNATDEADGDFYGHGTHVAGIAAGRTYSTTRFANSPALPRAASSTAATRSSSTSVGSLAPGADVTAAGQWRPVVSSCPGRCLMQAQTAIRAGAGCHIEPNG